MSVAYYEVYIETAPGKFERAPDPPPPEWREQKGLCGKCGEKVFVKAGSHRSFWTHGKGKTCVPKPNAVSVAIEAEKYAKNKGASADGDEELKSRFEDAFGVPAVSESILAQPTTIPSQSPPPAVEHHCDAVSLGWVEASLVLCGALGRLQEMKNMPPLGTFGRVAIHYIFDFAKDKYDRHHQHALVKYHDANIPDYDEIARNRRGFSWGIADYEVTEIDGNRFMLLSNVQELRKRMFQIAEGRRFWSLSSSDARLLC